MIIILAIFLIFGPGKIPEMARGLGKFIGDIKRASEDVKNEINREADRIEREEKLKEYKKNLDLDGEPQDGSKPDAEERKTKKSTASVKKKVPKADIVQEDAETDVKEVKRPARKSSAAKKTTKTAGRQTKTVAKPKTATKSSKTPASKPKTAAEAKSKPADKATTTEKKTGKPNPKTAADASAQKAPKVTEVKNTNTAKPVKRAPKKES